MPQYRTHILEIEVTVNTAGTCSIEILPVEGLEPNSDEWLTYEQAEALKSAVFSVLRNVRYRGRR